MKKFIKVMFSLVLVFSSVFVLTSCTEKEENKETVENVVITVCHENANPKVKADETQKIVVPDFTFTINGVTITEEDMAEYDIYHAIAYTIGSSRQGDNVYHGYRLLDVIEAAGLTGTPGKVTTVSVDGKGSEWEESLVNVLLVFNKDYTNNEAYVPKNAPQGTVSDYPKNIMTFAPLSSTDRTIYTSTLSTITIEGLTQPSAK